MYFQLVTSLLSSIASMTASSLAKLISWSLRASTRYILRRVSRSTDSTDRLFCNSNGAVESLIFHSSKCGPKEHDSAKTQQFKLLFIKRPKRVSFATVVFKYVVAKVVSLSSQEC